MSQLSANETKQTDCNLGNSWETKKMPRHTKFMLEANPRQQPSEMKWIPVTAIGKRNLSLARILYTRQQSLSGVGNCHWHTNKILGTSLCGVGKQSLLAWHQESVESWQQRQSIGSRQGLRQSGNNRRCGLNLDKKEPAILSFSLQE